MNILLQLSKMGTSSQWPRSYGSRRGVLAIEYVVIALAITLATIAFFGGGSFGGAKGDVEQAVDGAISQLLSSEGSLPEGL